MFNTKNKIIYLAIAIFIVGIFLRTYHFTDWLHFELDQARDVFIISDAIDGTRDLPLLGPQARGRELQLGPIFYYFQFFSAKIFARNMFWQNTSLPVAVAFPDLLFSILTIPLSYFFARQFFSRRISFLLFTITSFSYFLIIYGRFAWNPNSMPFWLMLAAYSLLRCGNFLGKDILPKRFYNQKLFFNFKKADGKSVNDCEKVFCPCGKHNFFNKFLINFKNWFVNKFFANKKISRWFILAIFSTAILLQLHFIAFLCFPVVFIIYFIFSKIRISWQTILISLSLIILLFFPVIVNEYKTGGKNTKGLIASVTEDKNDKHDLAEKTFRAFQESSTFFFTIFTGDQHGRDLLITKKQTQGYFPLICDKTCKERLLYLILAIILFLISLATFFFYIFKRNFYVVYKKSGLRRDRKSIKLFFRRTLFAVRIYLKNFSFSRVKEYFRISTRGHDLLFRRSRKFCKNLTRNCNSLFRKKHSAIFLILPWLVMGGLFLILVAYQISPRFFLFMYPPFLILLGSVFYFIEKVFRRFGKFITIGLTIIFIVINLFNIKIGFTELHLSRTENIESSRDLVLKRSDRIILSQLRDVADYILESENKSGNNDVGKIVVGDNRYARAIFYLVNSKSEGEGLLCYVKRGGFEKEIVSGGNFYLLVREKTGVHVNDEMLVNHMIVDERSFGTLKLYVLMLGDDVVGAGDVGGGNLQGCFVR
ncbi:MAG: hypothetical protein KAT32_02085 [Candidatus Moranbacteria bacterium]|nr:hypothetical protein [Candidatus Moranbacteria bacterium]